MLFNFTVRGDKIIPDKDYTFTEGNKGSYEAVFAFSEEWDKYVKIGIISNNGTALPIAIIEDKATIPQVNTLTAKIGVIGVELRGDGTQAVRLSTNMKTIGVNNGAASSEGLDALSMAAEVWEKYLVDMESSRSTAQTAAEEAKTAKELAETSKNMAESFSIIAQNAESAAIKASNDAEAFDEDAREAATAAAEAAENAKTSEQNAKASEISTADAAEAAGNAATFTSECADEARGFAEKAQGFAEEAKNSVEEAKNTVKSITDMTVSVQGLNEGEAPSVKKGMDGETVHLSFGIPKGDTGPQGEKGDKGDTGPQGEKGEKGDEGYTPIKGTDYFTEEEKEEMLNSPRAVIPLANGMRIESADSGVWITSGTNSKRIYDEANARTLADHAKNADYAKYDSAGNHILATYATKEEVQNTPREVIRLANGMCIESRKDGIWLVTPEDTEKEIEECEYLLLGRTGGVSHLYVANAEYADNAGSADGADYAYSAEVDMEDRPLKGTDIEDIGDVDTADIEIHDGTIVSYGIISESLIATLPDDYQYIGFISGLYFTTPSVIPENYTQFDDKIYFKGDSTQGDGTKSTFVPEADTRYTIAFDFDGNMVNGYVSGVPAPPVSEVTENE